MSRSRSSCLMTGCKPQNRILILEDTKGDGTGWKQSVFVDKLTFATGIQTGFGGVYVGAPPNLLFFPDKNADDKPDAWWLAWRLIGEREGRVGVFYDEWVIAEGTGKEAFPEACADWFPRGEVVRSDMSEKPTELPMPEILVGLAPLARPVPQDPMVVLQVVGQLTDAEIAHTGLQGIQVIAFRGLTVEQFIVRGRFLFDVDDFMRTVAQQGDNIDAIALIMVGVMQLDGLDTRAIIAVAEVQDGRRARRAMPLRFGPNGSIEPPRFWASEMPPAEPGKGWLGVAPTQDISLFPMPPKGQEMAEG